MEAKKKFDISKFSFSEVKKKAEETKISVLKKALYATHKSYHATERVLNKSVNAASKVADKIDNFAFNAMSKTEKAIKKRGLSEEDEM